jgi:small subunit ribosomal protein S3
MGQKIHPTGFRLSVNRSWGSRWFARGRQFSSMLLQDIDVRDYLRKKLQHASVSRVVIERPAKNARVTVHSARPGVVIGKKGEDIELLRADLQRRLGMPVHVDIAEVRKPEIDAQLIADSIAQQLEKRIMFRRAMKRSMQNAMRLGAQGIKIMSSGRLNGIEIARTEWYREGRVPLHTLRADIDYGLSEAKTTYGVIGIKVWVFKGMLAAKPEPQATLPAESAHTDERKARRSPSFRARPDGEGAQADAVSGAQLPALPQAKKPVRRSAAKPALSTGESAPARASTDDSTTDNAPSALSPKPAVKRVRKPAAKTAAAEKKE